MSDYEEVEVPWHSQLQVGDVIVQPPHDGGKLIVRRAKAAPDWERVAGEYSRQLDRANERLRVIDRRIDRVDLAKRLFLKRMGQAYATVPEGTLEDLWHDQDASCQNAWLVVADEAIRLTLATDL